jgi:hypothetical protein
VRWLQLQHHDGDEDGHHAITECFQAVCSHGGRKSRIDKLGAGWQTAEIKGSVPASAFQVMLVFVQHFGEEV